MEPSLSFRTLKNADRLFAKYEEEDIDARTLRHEAYSSATRTGGVCNSE